MNAYERSHAKHAIGFGWGRHVVAGLVVVGLLAAHPAHAVSFMQTGDEHDNKSKAARMAQQALAQQLLDATPADQEIIQVGDMLFRRSDIQAKSAFVAPMWTNGIVYYAFFSDVTQANRQKWLDAAQEWADVADVTFVPWSGNEPNYIAVANSTSNSSFVGMIGGQQQMNIFNWDYRFIIAHEIGHALGLTHEQCRSDRDNFVTIHFNNIISGFENNFAKFTSSTDFGAYDFNSVMHYRNNDFSIDPQNLYTITPQPAYSNMINVMGQRQYLSALDKSGMAMRYGNTTVPPPPTKPTTGGTMGTCNDAITVALLDTFEEVLPMDVGGDPDGGIAPNQPIAVRINMHVDVVPDSVWMTVEGDQGYYGAGGRWRPSIAGDNADGWAIYEPNGFYNDGERLTVMTGATLEDGTQFGPVSYEFNVSADATYSDVDAQLQTHQPAKSLDTWLADAAGPAYRLAPDGVYDHAVVVQLPVPDGFDADELAVYYLSPSERHPEWFPIDGVTGLVVLDSRKTVTIDGGTYIELALNHSAVLQLGVPAETNIASLGGLPIDAGGGLTAWVSFLAMLAILLGLLKNGARNERVSDTVAN